ncbi:hypothetical protein OIE66_06585 [Nonomuraea sp. NBC_01738]|uniref:hypothetical protein n=1 Tax=Nonomuraea sp. NBC_01738 TaxID=2976003 RepID=UPI002E14444D|nr:hypothetical protein OIE66_06585 [Nonomuraea sp. NBC_01738]
MADDTGESKDDVLVWVWGLLGGIAGIVASAKYAQSAGFAYEEKLSTEQGLLLVGLLFAPVFLSVYIGDHFHKAVQLGRMSWEIYWTVLSGIAAATFTFLGITGVDDVLEAGKLFFSGSKESP